ncbi:MAG: hypothetical protein RJA22_2054 [Verrucomicrobiota bacterium]|jgi:predicted PurR-regulated permease PerM
MTKAVRISYWAIAGVLILVGVLRLGTPLIAALLSFFALQKLSRLLFSKWATVLVFSILVLGSAYILGHFARQAVVALPAVAESAIPSIIDYAEQQGIDLPFTDWKTLKEEAVRVVTASKDSVGALTKAATWATRESVLLIIGLVVAVSLFLNSQFDLDRDRHAIRNNLYSVTGEELATRFEIFYRSFTTVMGAQIIISAINTVFTSIFVLSVGLPHPAVIIVVTFLCGLLPVVGNLISNTVITAIAFTVSPKMAVLSLGFLIVIHKLEYFLNSKIIGDRIRNPVWLTLLGLILGEKLMGIPGMVLAPVVLNYIKVEASGIEFKEEGAKGQ